MKKLILPFVLGAMMVSCSRDNDDAELTQNPNQPNTPAETPVLLTKVVNTEENGHIEITQFEYDGDKLVKMSSGYEAGTWSTENIITYTGDLITFTKDRDSRNEEGETTYTYDSQKRLKTVIETSRNSNRAHTTTRNYTHNADGTVVVREIKKTDYTDPQRTDTEIEKIITYTVVNGLITKVEENANGVISTSVHTYDDKNGPLKNVRGIKEIVFELFNERAISSLPHNRVSSVEGQDRATYTYEYNDNNYPKKVNVVYSAGEGETYEYFYNK